MQLSEREKVELAEVYEKAAEYAERVGWRQHEAGEFGVPRCFIGLTASAVGESRNDYGGWTLRDADLWSRANLFAEKALQADEGMITWNDDPDRTVDEVINTLHALANKLR